MFCNKTLTSGIVLHSMSDYVAVDLGVRVLTQFFEPNARMKVEL